MHWKHVWHTNKCVDKWSTNLWRNKFHTNFTSSNKFMCQMCFQCTISMRDTYKLWMSKCYMVSICKLWNVKFVMMFAMTHWLLGSLWRTTFQNGVLVSHQKKICWTCDGITKGSSNHARSAESWQEKTQHHPSCKFGSFCYESHSSLVDIEIKLWAKILNHNLIVIFPLRSQHTRLFQALHPSSLGIIRKQMQHHNHM
jgi:hypothetical protein